MREQSGLGEGRRVRIGINAHLLSGEAGYRRAGIHQYIYQVLRHLPLGPEYVIFSRQADNLPSRPDFSLVGTRWPTERRAVRIAWEQVAWPPAARRRKVDLLHSMAFVAPVVAGCPTVVTVYDLSFIHFPESFPGRQRAYLAGQTRRSCRAARRVVVISEDGAQDVHRTFGIPLERIDVVLPGLDGAFSPLPAAEVDAFRRREALPPRFVLHVGTLQPRKNIPVLLNALAALPDRDVHLILVGGKGWLYDEIYRQVETLRLGNRVKFAGYVDDAQLPLWYNAAEALVFPSVYEGFGLPIVEAMACGAPVIAAATSSLPEAGGPAARYFNPQDVGALTQLLENVLNDSTLREDMRRQGLLQARRFSWERAGRETAEVYYKALGVTSTFDPDRIEKNA